jgi:Mu-like prophage FluMu N-terminal domain
MTNCEEAMIKIISKKDGFRRCGVAHTEAPTEYPDDAFSDDQLEILMGEPMLVVEIAGVVCDPSFFSISTSTVPNGLNAKETIKLVQEASDISSLDVLGKDEERKTVLEAIEQKRAELQTKPAILDRDK